ncbi:MAG: DNA/RNA non-specific endonuclease [Bacteroidales bacterium]|nr:DNA/RNA non-specific endonuclease [Bacteroidales bacterium]MBQ2482663.1 DNA/RNA non-specific endonuclease [Bacteroidales bacterium]MBQ2492510.1 DNA/RNA non-specific endonuclease [Bacteroidales bacterium]
MKPVRNILLAALLATTMLLAAACGGGSGSSSGSGGGKDKPVTPDAVVTVTFRSSEVEAVKGSQFINISASGSWTLSSSAPWLTVSASSGSGNTTSVSVSYTENTSSSDRTATLTLTSSGKTATATLTQKGKETTPSPDTPSTPGASPGWLELPEVLSGTNHKFVSHKFASAGRTIRSFSYDWSTPDLVAHWVAYPLNKALIGTGNRTDLWAYDPQLTTAEQPTLFSAYKGGYDRGHQIPSADRLTYADNVKTFYFTNMTPQLNSLNGQIWATAESKVRGWASSCDTLYVVTGCVVKGSTKKAYDNNGKAVTVPVGYYKAVLRYVKNGTLGYSGYMGLAMYFEHKAYSQSNITKSMTDIVMSIDALEAKIGVDLFPNLATVAGKTVSDNVEKEDPTKVSYWW